jgi:hypothetical protein
LIFRKGKESKNLDIHNAAIEIRKIYESKALTPHEKFLMSGNIIEKHTTFEVNVALREYNKKRASK